MTRFLPHPILQFIYFTTKKSNTWNGYHNLEWVEGVQFLGLTEGCYFMGRWGECQAWWSEFCIKCTFCLIYQGSFSFSFSFFLPFFLFSIIAYDRQSVHTVHGMLPGPFGRSLDKKCGKKKERKKRKEKRRVGYSVLRTFGNLRGVCSIYTTWKSVQRTQEWKIVMRKLVSSTVGRRGYVKVNICWWCNILCPALAER